MKLCNVDAKPSTNSFLCLLPLELPKIYTPTHLNESTRLRGRGETLPELMVEEKRKEKVLDHPQAGEGLSRPEGRSPATMYGGGGCRKEVFV